MRKKKHFTAAVPLVLGLLALNLSACGVSPTAVATGGVDLGAPGQGCERGLLVVESDFNSTNVAVARLDGTTLSSSFISSAARPAGLTLALSGDVVVPRSAPGSGQAVLIDRFGTNVLTWVEVATARVLGQLAVGQGFESNPQDYLEVGPDRALLSRLGSNPRPGAQPFDAGGDLLVLDTHARAIAGHVALPEEDPALQPQPGALLRVGGTVVVSLGRMSADFANAGDGRLVGVTVDTSTLAWTVDIHGLQNCGRPVLSPSGALLAVPCSSRFDPRAMTYSPAGSDLVLFDAHSSPPHETRRFGLGLQLGAAIQPEVAFASEDLILGATFGSAGGGGDLAFALDLVSGASITLATARAPFALGTPHCAPGCGDVCLLPDAGVARLRRWKVSDRRLEALSDATVESIVGLPPRSIGGL